MSWQHTLTIEAEPDPIVTIRVSALVAVDNTIPDSLTAIKLLNGQLRLVVVLSDLDERHACTLAKRIENIPMVNEVHASRSWRNQADG